MNQLIYILIICVIVLVVYYRTKRFTGFWGITLFALAFLTIFLRLSVIDIYPVIGFYNPNTIVSSE